MYEFWQTKRNRFDNIINLNNYNIMWFIIDVAYIVLGIVYVLTTIL